MGAGDAFFSMSSVLYAASGNVMMAGFCGNLLASLQVDSVGQAEGLDDILYKKFLKSVMA